MKALEPKQPEIGHEYWKHSGKARSFPCYINNATVCARCCVEHCHTHEPNSFALCQSAGHPTWPSTTDRPPRRLVCIEGYWDPDSLVDRQSVRPFLDGLAGLIPGLQIAYRRVHGGHEFRRLVDKVLPNDPAARDAPIIYLAFHGNSRTLGIGNGMSLDKLANYFHHQSERPRLFYISSCLTLGGRGTHMTARRLLKETGASAIIGYTRIVPWVSSMLVDLHFMDYFYAFPDPWSSLSVIGDLVRKDMALADGLGWRMILPSDTAA